jgi:dihydrofolate synthase/folylpolyglutamate synthase
MTYEACLEYIHSLNRFGKKAGLENIRHLLSLMGDPQKKLRFVHIAGTNGKGSTTTMTASALQKAGYRTGKYISPFVLEFGERMQVDGTIIPNDELVECTEYVKGFADRMTAEGQGPIEFEVVTAVAMEWFCRRKCDVVCLEVGIGGRFDATNAIDRPLVSAITSISLDHVEILGDTLEKIAFEKCGIIKEGGITVCYPDQRPEALAVIMEQAALKNNRFIMGNPAAVTVRSADLYGTDILYGDLALHIPLLGAHQIMNTLTAVEILRALRDCHGMHISDADIAEGIAAVRFPARMEVISREPMVILDGAHNLSGAQALADAFSLMKGRPVTVITGMLGDKDFSGSMSLIAPLARRVITVTPNSYRALSADKLAEQVRPY